ncbi:MAG: hypothetical protein EHM59_11755 [Betaproteobacteria bacterium]|nr:MAG: hypothetical protein EHM59_11755 [Betaproteobacteria bacterium]
MKRSLASLLMVAFLIAGASAGGPRFATQFAPAAVPPKTDIAVQANAVTKPADAPTTSADAAKNGKVTSANALKLIMLQWLIAR